MVLKYLFFPLFVVLFSSLGILLVGWSPWVGLFVGLWYWGVVWWCIGLWHWLLGARLSARYALLLLAPAAPYLLAPLIHEATAGASFALWAWLGMSLYLVYKPLRFRRRIAAFLISLLVFWTAGGLVAVLLVAALRREIFESPYINLPALSVALLPALTAGIIAAWLALRALRKWL
ncbi:P. aerophilum family 550 protein [Pyrobaculum aerophilum str. IM2]|uniref:P. aerophilum family 550 protein n=1 Tax=Pyrobaculum aerophilum (strain ATCC 51768 / DSM 7523 / JCM 9630 / CIP 104966 / NBRC 100827 / IM2) TaxID=178306 RepID=Q8ZWM1_PYRAE|nr:P. aerophilum family 550 protein [Pyrobaculum aerophilum str. IM2]